MVVLLLAIGVGHKERVTMWWMERHAGIVVMNVEGSAIDGCMVVCWGIPCFSTSPHHPIPSLT